MKFSDYTFPSKYDKPFEHQVETVEFLLKSPRAFVLSDMGCGKTLSVLWALDFLMINKKINKVLIIAPLSTLRTVWANEIFMSLPHRRSQVIHGSKPQRLKRLGYRHDFAIINFDGIGTVADQLYKKYDVIVIDEATAYKTASTKRFKDLKPIVDAAKGVWAMTGSPTPNSPIESFGLAKITNPTNPDLPKYFTKFRESLMVQINQFTWIPRDGWEDIVAKVLSPGIRHKRDDVIDLPPVTYEDREVPMSPDQAKVYNSMFDQFVAEYEDGLITAANSAVKAIKLLQIATGTVYNEDREVQIFDVKPRLNEIYDIYQQDGKGKLIVFTPFKASVDMLLEFLSSKGLAVSKVTGDVASQQRSDIFNSFQHGDLNVIVAIPQAMSHGLTLTAAATMIWSGPVASGEVYQQACARITRPGQIHNQLIVHLYSSKIENKIFKALKNKERMADALLSLYS